MADRYGTARTGGLHRATVAGVAVDYRLEYTPGNTSNDPDDEGRVVGGVSAVMHAGQRRCRYGYGYVYSDGSVVRPMLDCDSSDGELGDDDDLDVLLGTSSRQACLDVQELIPSYVEPWRWGRSLG